MGIALQWMTLMTLWAAALGVIAAENSWRTGGDPDEAAAIVGEPQHPHARWAPASPRTTWTAPYPGYWPLPKAGPYINPYPPGRWPSAPSPPAASGFPPSQWFSTPRYPAYTNPYPPSNWQAPQYPPGWGPPYPYPRWEPGYRYRGWESPYPAQPWQGR